MLGAVVMSVTALATATTASGGGGSKGGSTAADATTTIDGGGSSARHINNHRGSALPAIADMAVLRGGLFARCAPINTRSDANCRCDREPNRR